MSQRFYRPELDALRFFAFLLVFCDHIPRFPAWFLPIFHMGAFGLPMFFMLSAYLIVTLLVREGDRTGTVSIRAFAMRRILRIWPLYLLSIVLALLWPHIVRSTPRLDHHGLLGLMLLTANVYVLHYGWQLGVINPMWSIGVEEQFYVLVPWLGKAALRRWMLPAMVGTIGISYAVLLWLAPQHPVPITRVWGNSFVQFQFFAAGGVLALWNLRHDFVTSLPVRLLLAACGFLAWYAAAMWGGLHLWSAVGSARLIGGYLLTLAGTLLLFLSVLQISRPLPAFLLYLGRISFGLYVFHPFALSLFSANRPGAAPLFQWTAKHAWAGLPLAFASTVAVAALSFRFFESPILRLKKRFEIIRTR